MKKISLLFPIRWLKILITSLVLFFIGLGLGIAISFPSGILQQRLVHIIEQQGQISMTEGSFGFGFINLTAKGVVIAEQPDKNIPSFRIDTAKVSPLWGSLLSENPGIHIDGSLMSGNLVADILKNGQISASAHNLLLEFPVQNGWNLTLSGQLQQADLESLIPLTNASQSELDATLKNVSLREEGKEKAMLNLGNIDFKAKGRGQAFRITQLSAQGGDFEVTGRGNLRLGTTPRNSTASLRVTIKPTGSADPGMVELLKLAAKETPNGEFQLRISGNLANPTVR